MTHVLRKITLTTVFLGFLAIFVSISASAFAATSILSEIKRRGYVACGATTQLVGFSTEDEKGEWHGFEIDFCRALAAAILNDPTKIRIRQIDTAERLSELQKKRVDVVLTRLSATMTRETHTGLTIPAITYFDGQGILIRKSLGITSIQELEGSKICVQKGTIKASNLSDYFKIRKISFEMVSFDSGEETFAAYEAGKCDAVTADMSTLYSWRVGSPHADDYTFLPDVLSKEPLGPAVLGQDEEWARIVRWVHMAMINAEELGITRNNVEVERESPNFDVRRLLGVEGNLGQYIGLDNDWAYRIIRHVGNYGEVFERNLGERSQLRIKRGQNALWFKGGLQYGIPIR